MKSSEKKHKIFITPDDAKSNEYQLFWNNLAQGKLHQGQYKRIGKNGKIVWIQATYNPVFDITGKVSRVVKFATDISNQVQAETLSEAVKEILAVIETTTTNNMTQRVNMEGKSGIILSLCQGINHLIDNMVTIIHQIRLSSDAISSASKEIAEGNLDLSERTSIEAGNLQNTVKQ